jgi:dipeptidyl aminopeptidase/acylaminoacyl peptidase
MNADGSEQKNLTESAGHDFSPNWSPDGTRLVFRSHRTGNADIWMMNADGSDPVNLTDDGPQDLAAAWSPDGAYIVYDKLTSTNPFTYDLFALNVSSGTAVALTSDPGSEFDPDWQPLNNLSGDTDCDGGVDAVDALHDLRYTASIAPFATCVFAGNVKCDDAITAVDSLFILRYVAQLAVDLPQGCPEIGA